ncbi:HD domain-containing protein [Alicyclobacillus sp. SO9]|uniref:HD domain-containing protein n=1 Tax=Alicyclobacillus sp. SO9 TaxID=2665646 RepID=UPI0018E6EFBB|nr:HD domain-containing protein [Alicyclobacillus sp. SO9]
MDLLIPEENLLSYVLDAMAEAVVVVDPNLRINYVNNAARCIMESFARTAGSPVGTDFNAYFGLSSTNDTAGAIEDVLQTGVRKNGVLRKLPNGITVRMNVVPLIENEAIRGVLLTAQDVSELTEMEEELNHAFSLTLPNSKVEHKLKNTVEYQDEFNPVTKQIRITGIIQEGLYRHVVNSLKILASLSAQGITKVIGINKDELVQAIIFHDLGKVQPDLQIGDVVNPVEVFEDSKLHAFRGAELAQHYYHQSETIVQIIRYHHHYKENELPETFPWKLIPMLRLFQLIDGLSAAMTRGGVEVDFRVENSTIYVTERNRRPQYNGSWRVNIYTGERHRLD